MKTESRVAYFRFYEELNDFLPPTLRKVTFPYQFTGTPAIKDVIEALGVPHTEIDLLLVNGTSVGFEYRLQPGDRVAVYPVFESFNISAVSRVRSQPLRIIRFILDVHLGKLARRLRLLGFDTLYENHWDDHEIVDIAVRERRIILTRDKGLLKHTRVTHGYWIRSTQVEEQVKEVLKRFDLHNNIHPFTRCLVCNGVLHQIDKKVAFQLIPPRIREEYEEFYQCQSCQKIYWEGSHYDQLTKIISSISGNDFDEQK
ncbi:MAG: twitching motility protein PilT [Methanobacteriota archaeon]|nr:MAG: twitching motility protein PilT [Euryarchaeota archaeon]